MAGAAVLLFTYGRKFQRPVCVVLVHVHSTEMINVCAVCDKPLHEGDRVTVTVTSTYHLLKSTVAYALDKYDMEAHGETLKHETCH